MSSVHQFFVAQALHLRGGRFDVAARSYATPLVISLPDVDPSFVVISHRAGIERFFELKHAGLRCAGISFLRASVRGVRANGPDRIAAEVDWYYIATSGLRSARTNADYFLERGSGGLAVHMIEFKRLAFPALVEWYREAGRTTARLPL